MYNVWLRNLQSFMKSGETKAKVSASASVRVRRGLRFAWSRTREVMKIGKALVSTKHPFLVHIIPMRRCNLDCGYCNEYDEISKPVPLEEMKRRLDLLAEMGTSMITISGGEPLMHPELEQVIRHVRKRGMYAGMITNGFLLSKERIGKLNDAGLEFLQISIDNVTPDEVSKKSLKTLDIRLQWLAQYAVFQVNINSVLGSAVKNPEDALDIAHRAVELGFTSTVGIIHDGNGQLKGLNHGRSKFLKRS
jgi:MoaA/NifB/PqqE/SkfB family radical SAM enzyme